MSRVLLITCVLLLLLWWLWPLGQNTVADVSSSGMSQPNVVTRQSQQIPPKSNQTNRPTTATSPGEGSKTTGLVGAKTTDDADDRPLTYLDVYRKTRLFDRCRDTIYRFLRDPNQDPMMDLQQKLNRLAEPNEIAQQPTSTQSEAVIKHHEQCTRLLAEIDRLDTKPESTEAEHVDDLFNQKRELLHMWLSRTTPKSAKEQAIAQTLHLKQAWINRFDAVVQVSMGDDSQHQAAIAALNEQAAQVQVQIDDTLEQLRQTEDKTFLQEQLGDLSEQHNQIQNEINELNWVDPEKRTQAVERFNAVNDELFALLTSRDPDVFYETQMTLEKTSRIQYLGHSPYKDIGQYRAKMPFVEYVSPGDVVMQALEMADPEMFRLVIQHATQLYLCELGAQCGPDSAWIEYYCFASYDQIDAVSCDLDLPTYLRQHRLNDNQWQDVTWVLDMLRGLYGS